MDLSVIIVNYNVKFFLEQCLHSVEKAGQGLAMEVFVVDNLSVDGSCAMVKEKFPWVHLIENQENVGFSKANNQAIRRSVGKYVLLLNPDTVVEEHCFHKVFDFAEANPDAGGIGVKMIDGKGRFLPESKRAFPTPMVSFYKIFGLASLLPHSKRFGRYHLGHLDAAQNHSIEILAGAFMWMRRSVLDQTGLLDEQFFMYGEDIDLSYRIIQAGYRNYYFSETTIIHYKGESTKKGSINYVRIFYQAMILFARKHFSGTKAGIYISLINLAIYLRAGIAILSRFVKRLIQPAADLVVIYLGYFFGLPYWESYKFGDSSYPPELLRYLVPSYVAIWVLSLFFNKAYRKPFRLIRFAQGLAIGTIVILLIYSLLSEQYRFSRALILMGFAWSLVSTIGWRVILGRMGISAFRGIKRQDKRIVVVGGQAEADRIHSLITQTNLKVTLVGIVSQPGNRYRDIPLGMIQHLHEIVQVNRIDEIVFSGKDVASQEIIAIMHRLSDLEVDFKIAPPESISVIGSNSIDTAGELYVIHASSVAKAENVRKKRAFDLSLSFASILLSPLLLISPTSRRMLQFLPKVISGSMSWVGYHPDENNRQNSLPEIKPGVFNPLSFLKNQSISHDRIEKSNLNYSKDYRILNDLSILLKSLLG